MCLAKQNMLRILKYNKKIKVMTELQNYLEGQFKMLDRGIVATPNSREDLEAFAKANKGSMDIILMQMAVNYGYKIAMENIQFEINTKK